ncbi:hypothetical protein [Xylocopilactobacillus apis]|uniref:DUF1659 domain-containing protein n=1 Tax=Xylocopilactobacillus apis TaxID=2932183 RepID=A0AAU9D9J7_9LACO|nr:hypothetical protein [Xylocopilactobacillus apis]BDR55450.1 hypothetical protein KIMC2_00120 [Xylocopilactobacillus apis]BDR57482.1 hypothetical protein KIMC2_20440 [Xylocopilactobacillus apis]
MSKVLKTNLQVTLVKGADRKTKTFSNVVAGVDDVKAQKLGQVVASLSPNASLEQVRAVETKEF